jgi:hypothetical protein
MNISVDNVFDAYGATMHYSTTKGCLVFRMFAIRRGRTQLETNLNAGATRDILPVGIAKLENDTFLVLTDTGCAVNIKSLAGDCKHSLLMEYLKTHCKGTFNSKVENVILKMALKAMEKEKEDAKKIAEKKMYEEKKKNDEKKKYERRVIYVMHL